MYRMMIRGISIIVSLIVALFNSLPHAAHAFASINTSASASASSAGSAGNTQIARYSSKSSSSQLQSIISSFKQPVDLDLKAFKQPVVTGVAVTNDGASVSNPQGMRFLIY